METKINNIVLNNIIFLLILFFLSGCSSTKVTTQEDPWVTDIIGECVSPMSAPKVTINPIKEHFYRLYSDSNRPPDRYGSYTYVLINEYPSNPTCDYSPAVKKLCRIIKSISYLISLPSMEYIIEQTTFPERDFDFESMNIFCLPAEDTSRDAHTTKMTIENYDFHTAQNTLDSIKILLRGTEFANKLDTSGPFLITLRYPVENLNDAGTILICDLSRKNETCVRRIVDGYKKHLGQGISHDQYSYPESICTTLANFLSKFGSAFYTVFSFKIESG